MLSPNAICAVTALFVAGMVWFRTRMHYSRGMRGRRSLTAAGAGYFAALAVLLLSGWFAAPALARRLSTTVPVAPALARVVWFLGAYYLFIPVHLLLKARGAAVFTSGDLPNGGWRGL